MDAHANRREDSPDLFDDDEKEVLEDPQETNTGPEAVGEDSDGESVDDSKNDVAPAANAFAQNILISAAKPLALYPFNSNPSNNNSHHAAHVANMVKQSSVPPSFSSALSPASGKKAPADALPAGQPLLPTYNRSLSDSHPSIMINNVPQVPSSPAPAPLMVPAPRFPKDRTLHPMAQQLVSMGFGKNYAQRACKIYLRNFPQQEFRLEVLTEIILRLQEKDRSVGLGNASPTKTGKHHFRPSKSLEITMSSSQKKQLQQERQQHVQKKQMQNKSMHMASNSQNVGHSNNNNNLRSGPVLPQSGTVMVDPHRTGLHNRNNHNHNNNNNLKASPALMNGHTPLPSETLSANATRNAHITQPQPLTPPPAHMLPVRQHTSPSPYASASHTNHNHTRGPHKSHSQAHPKAFTARASAPNIGKRSAGKAKAVNANATATAPNSWVEQPIMAEVLMPSSVMMSAQVFGIQRCEVSVRPSQSLSELQRMLASSLSQFDADRDDYVFFHSVTGSVFANMQLTVAQCMRLIGLRPNKAGDKLSLKVGVVKGGHGHNVPIPQKRATMKPNMRQPQSQPHRPQQQQQHMQQQQQQQQQHMQQNMQTPHLHMNNNNGNNNAHALHRQQSSNGMMQKRKRPNPNNNNTNQGRPPQQQQKQHRQQQPSNHFKSRSHNAVLPQTGLANNLGTDNHNVNQVHMNSLQASRSHSPVSNAHAQQLQLQKRAPHAIQPPNVDADSHLNLLGVDNVDNSPHQHQPRKRTSTRADVMKSKITLEVNKNFKEILTYLKDSPFWWREMSDSVERVRALTSRLKSVSQLIAELCAILKTFSTHCSNLSLAVMKSWEDIENELSSDVLSLNAQFFQLGDTIHTLSSAAMMLSHTLEKVIVDEFSKFGEEHMLKVVTSNKELLQIKTEYETCLQSILHNKQSSDAQHDNQYLMKRTRTESLRKQYELKRYDHCAVVNNVIHRHRTDIILNLCSAFSGFETFFHIGYESSLGHKQFHQAIRHGLAEKDKKQRAFFEQTGQRKRQVLVEVLNAGKDYTDYKQKLKQSRKRQAAAASQMPSQLTPKTSFKFSNVAMVSAADFVDSDFDASSDDGDDANDANGNGQVKILIDQQTSPVTPLHVHVQNSNMNGGGAVDDDDDDVKENVSPSASAVEDERDAFVSKEERERFKHVSLDYYDGYLWKQSTQYRKKWQKRWFVLTNGELEYYRTNVAALENSSSSASSHLYDPSMEFKRSNSEKKKTSIFGNNSKSSKNKNVHKEYVGNAALCKVKKLVAHDYQYVFEVITPTRRTYALQAQNENEYDEWYYVLSNQCVRLLLRKNTVDRFRKQHEANQGPASFGIHDQKNWITQEKERLKQKIFEQNPFCADCGVASPAWCSINIGVILCVKCCGVHRGLGTHISKCRSLKLDNLSPLTLKMLLHMGGNEQLQLLLESNLNAFEHENVYKKITHSSVSQTERNNFIKNKYAFKMFISHSTQAQNVDYHQALWHSVCKNDFFGVLSALCYGADVNHQFERHHHKTAMHQAVKLNLAEMVLFLVNNDALPNTEDGNNKKPYEIAIEESLNNVDNTEIQNILKSAIY